MNKIPFIQAKWYTPVPISSPRKPSVIVLHSMEAPEKGTTAEAVARYFASGCDGRKASAHYCIDNDSVVQCVQCNDVAYGAPNMNRYGIHLEHAGYARQTRAEWLDAFGFAMLRRSAELCATVLCPKFGIKIQRLTDDQLKQASQGYNVSGFCTHADVTRALGGGTHTDPGPGFPFDYYLHLVRFYANR